MFDSFAFQLTGIFLMNFGKIHWQNKTTVPKVAVLCQASKICLLKPKKMTETCQLKFLS